MGAGGSHPPDAHLGALSHGLFIHTTLLTKVFFNGATTITSLDIWALIEFIKRAFWWPAMAEEVHEFVQTCTIKKNSEIVK